MHVKGVCLCGVGEGGLPVGHDIVVLVKRWSDFSSLISLMNV